MSAPAPTVLKISPMAPSSYSVRFATSPSQLATGTQLHVENSLGQSLGTFEIVGEEAIHLGWKLYGIRVREIGGYHDGNEFFAYLTLGG